jgi:3-methyl-2-oxobutanoate hydroxymethyltransferase
MATRKNVTLHRLREMHARGEKIAMLTCYDALFAHVLDQAGVDVLLVGDSLGMVLQGHPSTLPVTMEEMIYHTGCVARGNTTAWIIADMPFGSYQESAEHALSNAVRLMQSGAHMVKLEGGGWTAAQSCNTWSIAVFPCVRTWGSRRSRCLRSAEIAFRGATRAPPPDCFSTPSNWHRPEPPASCSRWSLLPSLAI